MKNIEKLIHFDLSSIVDCFRETIIQRRTTNKFSMKNSDFPKKYSGLNELKLYSFRCLGTFCLIKIDSLDNINCLLNRSTCAKSILVTIS